jgi:hypothetical protein
MEEKRRLIRLEVGDFLEIRPLNEVGVCVKGKSRNFSLMGVCFVSEIEWQKGQVLLIDYFIPEELDSVRLKIIVAWSEFIDLENGYFCGGEVVEVEESKQEKFANYYFKQVRNKFFK